MSEPRTWTRAEREEALRAAGLTRDAIGYRSPAVIPADKVDGGGAAETIRRMKADLALTKQEVTRLKAGTTHRTPPREPAWIRRQREVAEEANRRLPIELRRPTRLVAVRELGR